jgi:U3 small nucleolar ribonucleoprotein protein IMP3
MSKKQNISPIAQLSFLLLNIFHHFNIQNISISHIIFWLETQRQTTHIIMRKLKYHEQRLLRKVNFESWRTEHNNREHSVLQRYLVTDRDDYVKYNRICGEISQLVSKIEKLDPSDPFRIKVTEMLLNKLYNLGIINSKDGLSAADHVTVSAMCRRRLPTVLVKNKFCETLKEAVTFVQQGHVKVGTEVVRDPGFFITRQNEDFVGWTDSSKIRKTVQKYNNEYDDFDEVA